MPICKFKENTMHGRKCFILAAISLAFAGCSSNALLKPDCHSCTVEEQEWKEFSWGALEGKWRGSVENYKNEREQAKKTKTEKTAELTFVRAAKFLETRGGV